MRRASVVVLAVIVGLSACTSDEEPLQASSPPASPDEQGTPTSGPTEQPAEDDPSEEPDDGGTDGTSDGQDDGDTGSTDSSDPTDGDTGDDEGSATDGTDDEDPDTGSDTPGGPASDTPTTPVSYGPDGSAFQATTEHVRSADYSSRCYVEPVEGETFDECVRLYSSANEAWMTLVEATDDAGEVTVTLYHSTGAGFTSAVRAPAEDTTTFSLRETGWANTQDHLIASGPTGHDVLAWDREGDPRIVAHLPADGTTTFIAQRIVRRTSDAIEVLAVDTSGSGVTGSRGPTGSEEDVALQVYAAWIDGDRAAAEGLAVDKVMNELFEQTPASNDSFGLDGTDCGQAGTRVACSFTATFDGGTATMTWTLGTVDGQLQVVRIDS